MAADRKPGDVLSVTYFDKDMNPCPEAGAYFIDVMSVGEDGEETSTWYEKDPAAPDADAEHPAAGKVRDLAERSKAGSLTFDDLVGETKRIREHHGFDGLGAGAKAVGIDPAGHTDKSLLHAVQSHIRKQAPGRG